MHVRLSTIVTVRQAVAVVVVVAVAVGVVVAVTVVAMGVGVVAGHGVSRAMRSVTVRVGLGSVLGTLDVTRGPRGRSVAKGCGA